MKQTNLFNSCLSVGVPRFAKPVVMTLVFLGMLLMLGAQSSTGQTMVLLGEVKSEQAIKLIQGEIEFLQMEPKVASGSVNTEKNHLITAYYQSVLEKVRKGADFKQSLREIDATFDFTGVPGGTAELATSQQHDNSVMDPASADYRDLKVLIFTLNLSDDDDSDLEAIFNLWRTVKNR